MVKGPRQTSPAIKKAVQKKSVQRNCQLNLRCICVFMSRTPKARPSLGRHKYSRIGPAVNYLPVYDDYTPAKCVRGGEKLIVNHTF